MESFLFNKIDFAVKTLFSFAKSTHLFLLNVNSADLLLELVKGTFKDSKIFASFPSSPGDP